MRWSDIPQLRLFRGRIFNHQWNQQARYLHMRWSDIPQLRLFRGRIFNHQWNQQARYLHMPWSDIPQLRLFRDRIFDHSLQVGTLDQEEVKKTKHSLLSFEQTKHTTQALATAQFLWQPISPFFLLCGILPIIAIQQGKIVWNSYDSRKEWSTLLILGHICFSKWTTIWNEVIFTDEDLCFFQGFFCKSAEEGCVLSCPEGELILIDPRYKLFLKNPRLDVILIDPKLELILQDFRKMDFLIDLRIVEVFFRPKNQFKGN